MKATFIAAVLLCSTAAYAQEEINVEYRAVGKLTNENSITFSDDHMLTISGERAKYRSVAQERYQQYMDSVRNADPERDMLDIMTDKKTPDEGFRYIIFKNYPKAGLLTHIERKGNLNYLYEEPLPNPEWTLVEGDTTILTYACQKAVSHFRGRVWTAWYAPELPYDNGPWKLRGLPGLILKATEQDGIFSFEATGIEKAPAKDLKPAELPYSRCTRKEFTALLYDFYGDGVRFAMRQLGIMDDDTKSPYPPETPCLLDPEE